MNIDKTAKVQDGINILIHEAHEMAKDKGFWNETYGTISDNKAEKIALMHSELSEALEYLRKGPQSKSDHIPTFLGVEEELADLLIRVFDFCGRYKLKLGSAILAKMKYNQTREHKHGKRF